jgi:hypothetical protein
MPDHAHPRSPTLIHAHPRSSTLFQALASCSCLFQALPIHPKLIQALFMQTYEKKATLLKVTLADVASIVVK